MKDWHAIITQLSTYKDLARCVGAKVKVVRQNFMASSWQVYKQNWRILQFLKEIQLSKAAHARKVWGMFRRKFILAHLRWHSMPFLANLAYC